MEKKRIGKTLKIRWAILTGGEPESLAGRDLTLEISSGNRVRTTLSFVADGNVAAFVFEGSEQRYVGPYAVTMWENLGKEGQTVVDRCDAFCLVARSCEEAESGSAEDPGLEIESLDLGTSNFEAGVPGASAYELFKKHNPDSELTEEEYAESPVQAAGAALAMVEQLEETETEVKQAEQLRKQAEQGREASEQARATAEQGRVAAEQQRALAEQARVTNESARQTAEAGRQVAETKREENTAEAIRNSEEATKKAEDEAARVRSLADNPPKIVEVEGAKYWAFWDEETGQYVVSENRADVGDAVLFSPQTLTPQQQEQARKNINSAPGYYNQNGFVISPLGMSAIGFRYIAYKEERDSTICYILTQTRCLKMDFETFEVFWDVKVEGTTGAWHGAAECLRVIGNIVYVIRAGWDIQGGIHLVQLNDLDGSTIQTLEIPIKVNYGYGNFRAKGCPLITENYIYAVDVVDKQIKSFNINTLETSVVRDNISSFIGGKYQQLLWIINEENKPELVMINWFDDIIHLMRQDGTTIEIELEGSYNKSGFCIYNISLPSKTAQLSCFNTFYDVSNIQGSNGKYSGKITASRSLSYYGIDLYSNSKYTSPDLSMKVRNPNGVLFYYSPIFNAEKGALFLSNKDFIAMVADVVSESISNCYTNIKKTVIR